jgi:polyphosphate kinase
VESPELVEHLRRVVLQSYLKDTVNARELRPDGSYREVKPRHGDGPFDAQSFFATFYRQGSAVGQNHREPVAASL